MSEETGRFTRPATRDDLVRVVRLLREAGAEFVVVGGYALALHGLVRVTEDIDLAVDPSPANARRWVEALARLPDGVAAELLGEDDPFRGDRVHAIRINDEFTIDVLPAVAGIPWAALKHQAERLDLEGLEVPVLSLRGLLETKRGDRPKDRMDAEAIEAVLRELERGESGSAQ